MADNKSRKVFANLTGGRNGFNPPWEIADDQCADAVNVDYYGSPFARKRGGMVTPSLTGSTLAGCISSLARHVPGTDPTLAELWATDDSATPIINRLAGGTAFTAPTLKDNPTGKGWDFSYASINGKLMMAYKSAQPRMHLWDGSTVRRAGISSGGTAPTALDAGVGQSIVFDAASALNSGGPVTTLTYAVTVAASAIGNSWLFVSVLDSTGFTTGVTYNGVAMTLIGNQAVTSVFGFVKHYLFLLTNPTTGGAHNVVVTASGASTLYSRSVSYTGCNATGIDASAPATGAAVNMLTASLITNSPYDWTLASFLQDTNPAEVMQPGAGTVARSGPLTTVGFFDSNSEKNPAGVSSLTTTWTTPSNADAIIIAFTPSVPAISKTPRFYRQRWSRQVGGITVGMSEPTAIVSFTPSGTGTAVQITRATAVSESETHWVIEASIDGVTFYQIGTAALASLVFNDTNDTTGYPAFPLSPLTGFFSLPPAAKFIAADQGRLLMFGSYTTTDKQNDVVFSAVIGSSDISDEERIDTTTNYRLGLDENDSGVPTGLIGPVNSSYLAFKDRQSWLLTATGLTSQPYNSKNLSKTVGAVCEFAMDKGEDESGNACVYWMSHRGAYRWGLSGIEYIGRNMEDFVLPGGNSQAQINLAATNVVAVVRYIPDKRQVWFWWAIGSSPDPNCCAFYDVITGGWTRVAIGDQLASIRCAVMFSNTIGASMSRDQKPYIGLAIPNPQLRKGDTGTDDAGTNYQSYIVTKAYEPGGQGYEGEVGDALLLAKAASGVTITHATITDFGIQSKPSTGLLTPSAAGEARVSVKFQESGVANIKFVQHQVGDGAAVSNAWSLERLIVPLKQDGAVTK